MPRPGHEETFSSWLARTSEEYGNIGTSALLTLLRLPNRPGVLFGWRLEDELLMMLQRATGLRVDELRTMLLTQFGDGLCDYAWWWDRQAHKPWWWRLTSSTVCPLCVQSGGGWKLSWRLLPTVVCVKHEVYLHGRCPSCRSPFQVDWRGKHLRVCAGPPLDLRRVARPSWTDGTPGRVRPAGCGLRLNTLPVYPVRDSRVVERQETLLSLVTGAVSAPYTPIEGYFTDLLVALRLAVQLGRADMLAAQADLPLWSAFSLFERTRDRIAQVFNDLAYCDLASKQPGPMLMAAAMIVLSELREDWVSDPLRAVRRLYDDRLSEPDDRMLWDRALMCTRGFCEGVSECLNLRFPEDARLRWLISDGFFSSEIVSPVIPPEEHLSGLGEWALALTPVTPDDPARHVLTHIPAHWSRKYPAL